MVQACGGPIGDSGFHRGLYGGPGSLKDLGGQGGRGDLKEVQGRVYYSSSRTFCRRDLPTQEPGPLLLLLVDV